MDWAATQMHMTFLPHSLNMIMTSSESHLENLHLHKIQYGLHRSRDNLLINIFFNQTGFIYSHYCP